MKFIILSIAVLATALSAVAPPALAQPGAPRAASAREKKAKPGKAADASKPGAKAAAGKSLDFSTIERPYFVKNTFERDAPQSFVVVKSFEQFNGIFGVGMVMGGARPQVNAATFDAKIIVAVVKRGPMCNYKVESVTAAADGLEVRYEAKVDLPGSATFAVPLIVSVPKGDYAAVKFIENGKEVKVLK
jgi:hypothetical protein